MNNIDTAINIIKNYGFKYDDIITTDIILKQKKETVQIGIGDILLINICMYNSLISCPIYININYFINVNNIWKIQNIHSNIDFKLKLLTQLLAQDNIIFYNDTKIIPSYWDNNLPRVTDFQVLHKYFDFKNKHTDEYIIFHTKCRFTANFDYSNLKLNLKKFCKMFKSKYKILILGERIIPSNYESDTHKITTIYTELLELKQNNDVLDLTEDNIYDNLNYDSYVKDLSLIHHAKYNITVGIGGQYCNCHCFGKNTIAYISQDIHTLKTNSKVNHFYNIAEYLNYIKTNMDVNPYQTELYNKNAYVLSHLGLGDNITNIGAVRFLLNYYNNVYFLCKDTNLENVKLFFKNLRVSLIPIDSANEYEDCKKIILNTNPDTDDCFISGMCHTWYLQSRISHPLILNYVKNNKYALKYDHIYNFYNDIGLDTSIYVDYFNIDSSEFSKQFYSNIQNYNIIFLHTKGSDRSVDLSDIINSYKYIEDHIIICANQNVYDKNHPKYNIADKYVNIPIAYYIDIIKNAKLLHVINSCFSCIIYPLILSGQIESTRVKLYDM